MFTTRIFRSISLDTIPEPERDVYKDQCHLFLEFGDEAPEQKDKANFKEKLKSVFGSEIALDDLLTYQEWEEKENEKKKIKINVKVSDQTKCWVVEFKKAKDTSKAYKALKSFGGVKASYTLKSDQKSTSKSLNKRENNNNTVEEYVKPRFIIRISNVLIFIGFILLVISSIAFSIIAFQNNATQVPKLICLESVI